MIGRRDPAARKTRPLFLTLPLLALAFGYAGCGGGNGDDDPEPTALLFLSNSALFDAGLPNCGDEGAGAHNTPVVLVQVARHANFNDGTSYTVNLPAETGPNWVAIAALAEGTWFVRASWADGRYIHDVCGPEAPVVTGIDPGTHAMTVQVNPGATPQIHLQIQTGL